ncbi:hypothetical protein B0A48_00796 [Cryoendolithus antarcticus]|uniref:Uncharacterized protein n=1 Tax=Cryoendolithus antarcticus TaxID=1507870 RepID=A0A1V8TRN6_9PEZI|nr:hypothetical protein B0A48_00796 [Cryoendolithus antarcticus]
MAAAAPATYTRTARRLATDLLCPTIKAPIESLLSRLYAKPVTLHLTKLARPQLDAEILANLVTQKLRDRRNTPRKVIRDAVWRAQLPVSQSQVPSLASHAKAAETALARDPSRATLGRQRASLSSVVAGLRLKQVSSVYVSAAGRLGKRMTANRAQEKVARKGLTSKGPGFMVRGVGKAHTRVALKAGKRRVGAFGIRVAVGHS